MTSYLAGSALLYAVACAFPGTLGPGDKSAHADAGTSVDVDCSTPAVDSHGDYFAVIDRLGRTEAQIAHASVVRDAYHVEVGGLTFPKRVMSPDLGSSGLAFNDDHIAVQCSGPADRPVVYFGG